MVNRVTLIGNLGRDPEVRRLENGAVVAKFSVATSENYKDSTGNWQEKTEWHNVVVWRLLAEKAENSLKKGSMVYVEGKLSTRKWDDKDGKTNYTTDVIGNYFRVIPRAASSGSSSGYFPSASDEPAASPYRATANTTNNTAPPAATTTKAPAEPKVTEDVTESAGDDLPF